MKSEHTPEELEGVRDQFEQGEQMQQKHVYTPRPRWHLVMAWVLLGVVVLGIINLVYWQLNA